MEKVFVDTSALYALVSTRDDDHERAVTLWDSLAQSYRPLITNNYALAECFALVQNRLGLDFVRYLQYEVVPSLEIAWIDEEQHEAAINHVLSANRRNLSLVDCASFETMHAMEIDTVFTFDEHFREQGFNVIP
ncbi:MAG: PilT domain-containing protein [Anaerolineaceae bacterium]|nr:MAG: PilT domain-containing protein [Anaerolineaceae bacterium]